MKKISLEKLNVSSFITKSVESPKTINGGLTTDSYGTTIKIYDNDHHVWSMDHQFDGDGRAQCIPAWVPSDIWPGCPYLEIRKTGKVVAGDLL